jgi:hypothetical protein
VRASKKETDKGLEVLGLIGVACLRRLFGWQDQSGSGYWQLQASHLRLRELKFGVCFIFFASEHVGVS